MEKYQSESLHDFACKLQSRIPLRLLRNQRQLTTDELNEIKKSIEVNCLANMDNTNLTQEMIEKNLNAHLYKRLEDDRKNIIPG